MSDQKHVTMNISEFKCLLRQKMYIRTLIHGMDSFLRAGMITKFEHLAPAAMIRIPPGHVGGGVR